MSVNLQALLDQRKAALTEARQLVEKAETENRDLTADEEKRYGELTQKAKDLEKRAARVRDLENQLPSTPPANTPPAAPEGRFSAPNVQTPQPPRYSLLRALRCMAERRALDGFEGEVSQELARRAGKAPQGFFMPFDFESPLEPRALSRRLERRDNFDLTSGNDLKATIVDAGNFITLLRNRMAVRALGATILSGLIGDLSIPSHTGAGTAYWFDSESGSVTYSNQTTGQVGLAPSTVGAQTQISRKLLIQSSPDAEQLVRDDLAMVLALAIDLAAINGSGSGAEPEGILQNSSVQTVAIGDNGGAATWAKIVELESAVAADNADIGSLAYLTNALVRGSLKTIAKDTGSGQFIWDTRSPDSPVNGYPCAVSNQVPSDLTKGSGSSLSAMIFGNWADVMIGFWSGVDVVADPYTQAASGALLLTMLQDCDIQLRRTVSFAKVVDLST